MTYKQRNRKVRNFKLDVTEYDNRINDSAISSSLFIASHHRRVVFALVCEQLFEIFIPMLTQLHFYLSNTFWFLMS